MIQLACVSEALRSLVRTSPITPSVGQTSSANTLHGQAELQGDTAPGMAGGAHQRKIKCLPLTPSSGCLSEKVRAGCRGWVDGRDGWMALYCHLPTRQPNSLAWRATRRLGWEPAGKPETLPAFRSFHHDVPLSPFAPSQPPSSDAPRASQL